MQSWPVGLSGRHGGGDDMTELWLALSENGTIEFRGVVYNTGGTTLEVMADWEDWLAGEALDRLLRVNLRRQREEKAIQNGEAKAIKAIADLSAEGVFDFFGETSEKRLKTPSGLQQLFFLRIRQHHPDILKKTINEMVDSKIAAQLKVQWEKEKAAADAILPNAEAPQEGPKDASNGSSSSPVS